MNPSPHRPSGVSPGYLLITPRSAQMVARRFITDSLQRHHLARLHVCIPFHDFGQRRLVLLYSHEERKGKVSDTQRRSTRLRLSLDGSTYHKGAGVKHHTVLQRCTTRHADDRPKTQTSCREVDIGATLERHPFSRLLRSSGKLLHTS